MTKTDTSSTALALPAGTGLGFLPPPRALCLRVGCVSEDLARRRSPRTLEALVNCARAGDRKAFREVTEKLAPQLVRFVTGYLRGDEHTANDVVQDTFVQAWNSLDQINDGLHLRPWLYKVARFKAIDFLRRRGPHGTPMESIDYAAESGIDVAERRHVSPLRQAMLTEPADPWLGALQNGLARLPATYIAVVRLHYLHSYSAAEVARLLGLERAAVKMRLLRARKILKRLVLEEVEAGRES